MMRMGKMAGIGRIAKIIEIVGMGKI